MKFEIFDSNSFEKWQEVLDSFPNEKKDVYYSPEYYQSWIEHENASPICIFAEKEEVKLLYPFFKKEILNYKLDGTYYDIQSAYGYGGVITNTDNISEKIIKEFNDKVDIWCKQENVIAEFIRENPLLREKEHYIRNADFNIVRRNVYADFSNGFKVTNKSALRDIKYAKKNGLIIEIDEDLNTIEVFKHLYDLTFERLKMDIFYQFTNNYFHRVKSLLKENTKLINVKFNNQIIASALVFVYANKATHHLGASNFDYVKLYPNDILYAAMVEFSNANGIQYLSLGGGTTQSDSDSLLKYKRKFSNTEKDVYIGRKIHNYSIYEYLCTYWSNISSVENVKKYKSFFLKYRMGI